MTNLSILLASLQTTPHDREYLELGDTSAWTEDDRAEARRLLVAAAESGDYRAVPALWFTGSRQEVVWLLTSLQRQQSRVAIEATAELVKARAQELASTLVPLLTSGTLDDYSVARGLEVLVSGGAESALLPLLDEPRPSLVTAVIDRLWDTLRLDLWPQVPWTSLGLLHRRVALPLASFRSDALVEFRRLVTIRHPGVAGFPAVASTGMPPAYGAAMAKVRENKTPFVPFSPEELAALGADFVASLVVYGAECALNQRLPSGLRTVAQLAPGQHRDLFELAADSPFEALASTARELLATSV